jgi:hypothetical protein
MTELGLNRHRALFFEFFSEMGSSHFPNPRSGASLRLSYVRLPHATPGRSPAGRSVQKFRCAELEPIDYARLPTAGN